MRLRIGICAGEVLLIDGAVYGAPVNIAARLQALACPGGICVSEGLLDAREGAAAQQIEPLGRHELHNIARPVLVYRITEPTAAPRDAN
jgi:adenylate cyclase